MGTLTGFIAYKVLKAKKTKVTLFVIEGKVGKAIEEIKPGQVGFVIVDGEYWRAIAEDEIPKNAEVEVVGRKGAYLVVKKRASKRSG
jgi:membrane-bound serine protease (ClpP class)